MTEQDALTACQRGDPAGLETLVQLHQERAFRLAVLITRDPHLAEDVVADAFLTAFQRIGTFDATRPLAPWFHKVVATTALKALDRSRRVVPIVAEGGDPLEEACPSGCLPQTTEETLDWVARVEDRAAILAALRSLPPAQRAAIVLKYYADLKESEIAQALGVPRGTVKSRLFHGLARLRIVLAGLRPAE